MKLFSPLSFLSISSLRKQPTLLLVAGLGLLTSVPKLCLSLQAQNTTVTRFAASATNAARPTTSTRNLIVFSSGAMLSSIKVDDTFKGGQWTDITTGTSCWHPALSPDGKTLTFTTYGPQGGRYQIFSMPANGGPKTNLSQNSFADSDASWSPDGKKIVFTSIRSESVKDKTTGEEKPGPTRNEIYLMNVDGTEQTRLVTNPDATAHHFSPTWSPDGRHILFEAEHGGPSDLYVVRADGSNGSRPTLLVRGRESHASWSPDGKSIVVSSRRDGPMSEIYVMDADGKNPVRLTDNKAQDVHPCWNPDGRRIAFASDRSGEYEIYVMQRDGSNQQRIIQDPEEPNTDPFWSTVR